MKQQQQQAKNKLIKKEEKAPQKNKVPSKQSPVHQLPTIQDMMEIPTEEREERCQQYYKQVKPFIHQYMQKKLGSRVLQLIFKWGSQKVQTGIHQIVVNHWKDLIKSKYALYLIANVGRQLKLATVVEDAVLLQGSWEGAKIIQNFIDSSGDEGLKQLKDKFYDLWERSKNNDIKAQETLHNLTLKAIQKQYDVLQISKLIIRLSVGSMFAEEKQRVLEYLIGKVNEWVGDDQGVRLFFEVINHADPKQKKLLVRSFKGHVQEIVQLNNPSYVALIKLITEVDDTVMVQKYVLEQVQKLFPLMSSNKHAFSIIFSLFSPRNHNFNILGKYQHSVVHTQCKKTEEVRKAEIRSHLFKPLLQFLSGENLYLLLRHHINNKLVVAIYKSLQQDNQTQLFNTFVSKVAQVFLTDAKDQIKVKNFSQSLIADPNANKIIKSVLLLSDQIVDYFCDEFGKLAVANISDFLNTKASFVLLGLIQKGGRENLLNEVKRSRVKLQTAVAGQHYLNLLKKK